MGIFKVSIFQKSLPNGLNLSIYKKLASLKSDFLIMPEFFYADSSLGCVKDAMERGQYALDWLLKLNDSYSGVIIGGSIFHREAEACYSAVPIISEGQVVDWYRKRALDKEETPFVTPGNEPGIYLMRGQRFGVLIGKDALNVDYYKELADQGIRLIFSISNFTPETLNGSSLEEWEDEVFVKPARDHQLNIIKTCSTGTLFGQSLIGRSMVITPNGITWRVSANETDQEILKTVMITTSG